MRDIRDVGGEGCKRSLSPWMGCHQGRGEGCCVWENLGIKDERVEKAPCGPEKLSLVLRLGCSRLAVTEDRWVEGGSIEIA